MEEKTIHIPAIHCGHCTMTIQNEVGEIPGVDSVEADPHTRIARIRWNEPATWEAIEEKLQEIGFPPAG